MGSLEGMKMEDWMTFDEAWDKFYEGRDSAPSAEDREKANEVVAALGCWEFRPLVKYIRDRSNVIHVNSGFLVTKSKVPYAIPDTTYREKGFTHRLKFTNEGSRSGNARETPAPTRLVCALCLSEDHGTIECPNHPSNRG